MVMSVVFLITKCVLGFLGIGVVELAAWVGWCAILDRVAVWEQRTPRPCLAAWVKQV
jgi:hypothetical protein